ncbi:hypothetical protein [Salinarimonas sp.]|uniref:hypothetical protein n=1 Tax=Salinarimonas sp. TaxID=2766526 RepID=UPI00391D402D
MPSRILTIAALALTLAACQTAQQEGSATLAAAETGAVTGAQTDEARNAATAERIAAAWVGRPASEFFAAHGEAQDSRVRPNGNTAHRWRGGFARYSVGGRGIVASDRQRISLVCNVTLVADRGGIIQQVRVNRDTAGSFLAPSRCLEILRV